MMELALALRLPEQDHIVASFVFELYIVEAIVIAHQGTIDVESTEHGTTFKVHLPRTPTKSSGSESKSKHHAVH